MNVILESEKGDELVCIEQFLACSEGTRFSREGSHTFRVGERVRYVSFRQNQNLKENPAGWMAVFEANDGKLYAATQTYFVTKECWDGLKGYFRGNFLQELKKLLAQQEGNKNAR